MTQAATGQAERAPVGTVSIRQYGKYYLVKKLAEGGMAEIFLSKQVGVEGFEKNVVVKRMLNHLSSVQDFVSMFLDEARLAASLNHPNIVQILDLGFEEGCYFIAMEYLAGEDFSTVIRAAAKQRQYVPINVALKVVADAALGLNFAHDVMSPEGSPLNIVHRDVSPSNIFVTYTGQVKVLDFGIAKAESRLTQTTAGVVKGKYQYMSIEQASSGDVDRRADVYSLGVCLYEALTNTRPFARDSDLAILNAVLKNEYRPPRQVRPDLPIELEHITMKALAAKKEDRYQTAGELASDIESYLRATTSITSGKALAQYMTHFFGDDRVGAKTRIDSLASLKQKAGIPLDPRRPSNPTLPGVDEAKLEAAQVEEDPTSAIGVPKTVKREREMRRLNTLLMIIIALVLAMAGLVTWMVVRGNGVNPIVNNTNEVDASAVATSDPPDAAQVAPMVVAPTVDAGSALAAVVPDAGTPVAVAEVRIPTRLSVGEITATFRRHLSSISQCIANFRSDLPSSNGSIPVQVFIGADGKVTAVETGIRETKVGACIEARVKGIRFGRAKEGVGVTLPITYQPR